MRRPLLDPHLQGDNAARPQPPLVEPPTEPQRIWNNVDAVTVMWLLIVLFTLQYFLLNGYITLLLFCILITGTLQAPGGTLRLVESDPLWRIISVKFKFLFVGSLALYTIIYLGLYFNRTCVCEWGH